MDLRGVSLEAGVPSGVHSQSGEKWCESNLSKWPKWAEKWTWEITNADTWPRLYCLNAYITLGSIVVPITQIKETSVKGMPLLAQGHTTNN